MKSNLKFYGKHIHRLTFIFFIVEKGNGWFDISEKINVGVYEETRITCRGYTYEFVSVLLQGGCKYQTTFISYVPFISFFVILKEKSLIGPFMFRFFPNGSLYSTAYVLVSAFHLNYL